MEIPYLWPENLELMIQDLKSKVQKPLGHNCNHKQGFVKQNNVAFHHCSFKLKFINTFIRIAFWVNFINATVVTQNWYKI